MLVGKGISRLTRRKVRVGKLRIRKSLAIVCSEFEEDFFKSVMFYSNCLFDYITKVVASLLCDILAN